MSGKDEMINAPYSRRELNACRNCERSRRELWRGTLYCLELKRSRSAIVYPYTYVKENEICDKWGKGVDK